MSCRTANLTACPLEPFSACEMLVCQECDLLQTYYPYPNLTIEPTRAPETHCAWENVPGPCPRWLRHRRLARAAS